jgi:hypothetical protein
MPEETVVRRVLKVVNIDAQFPELKGGACNQRGRGTGTSVKAAAARAVSDLLRQPKLRRKHFSTFTAIISIGKQEETQ